MLSIKEQFSNKIFEMKSKTPSERYIDLIVDEVNEFEIEEEVILDYLTDGLLEKIKKEAIKNHTISANQFETLDLF